eukprot:Plantae.Rhodophyta-Purpureofilum_apyrenoidigerum.ctg3596.p1 GENE.Plantae.Rhodophyta-Purpureofilum_apyrenoidigerum.ctg3596~~Plantae.Rhodophyta-Purpureofilum_apyrenoidigerum.ctg3596.p1  ORF type:complete len:365 (+),score=96.50 Plantae.Rhodophyta-Purpureofilum_apyrenoidigerum.ctg3596:241-1335(+)
MTVKVEESNLAGIGSDLDRQLREKAAASEEAFTGAGSDDGVEIWRIEKFEPVKLSPSEYGVFYSGDSYIVLHTEKDEDETRYDLFYWLGKDSTQDELGAAAIYTVNIDDMLGGKSIQHREVQNNESSEFLQHFTQSFVCIDGGVDSGFTKVVPEEYTNRLLVVQKVNGVIRCSQVPLSAESLNKGDVFILDTGAKLYQWNGTYSNPFERMKAAEQVAKIEEMREGDVNATVIEGDDIMEHDGFWEALGCAPSEIAESAPPAETIDEVQLKKLFKISDEDGAVVVEQVAEGDEISRDIVNKDSVWLLSNPPSAALYAGASASRTEMMYFTYCVDELLKKADLPPMTPLTTFAQNSPEEKFEALFD